MLTRAKTQDRAAPLIPAVDLTDQQFRRVVEMVYRLSGINLKEGKEALVRARLMKRLRALKLRDFEAYLAFVESEEGRQELVDMIDVITTNKTSFFREIEHFRFLAAKVLPSLHGGRIRIWSAACSSGEEPYSIAMQLRESMAEPLLRDALILGTDISWRVLETARQGVYREATVQDIPGDLLRKYFTQVRGTVGDAYQVKENLRAMTRFGWLNLMESWPMKGPFDVIFCRNVMIYFDRLTQQRLINRFWDYLAPGGYLFVGHSEGLSSVEHRFRYIQPAVYRK